MNTWIFLLIATVIDVTSSVEVHFENKDGGFFLKHLPRQYYSSRSDPGLTSALPINIQSINSSSSILSIDKFTVFQTSEPASVRATYGPFSTKQTVPARYIVPDPLDALPNLEIKKNITSTSNAALIDAQELGTRHLDMSAHLVGKSISRDSPVLRVLFHAGSEAGTRRQILLARHQRICVLLHATLPGKSLSLSAACSPDGEDGVCLAQITIPADWWPPFPPPDINGKIKFIKTPLKYVQVSYSVLEPRTIVISDDVTSNVNDNLTGTRIKSQFDNSSGSNGSGGGCKPRVQIQPVTPLGRVPLTPNKSEYKELKADNSLLLLIPHGPLYPRSRLHVPVFLHPQGFQIGTSAESTFDNKDITNFPHVVAVVLRARVKSGVRILDATSTNPNWSLAIEINGKNTAATFTIRRRENTQHSSNTTAEELMTMLLEASEDGAGSNSWDGGRIMWSVRYTHEGDEEDMSMQTRTDQLPEQIQLQRQQQQQQLQQKQQQVIALHKKTLMPKVIGILKLFYDADILEEKAFFEWANNSRNTVSKDLSQEIHDKAAPFITWLKEAEEEESETDDDDDDLEIEYDDRAKQPLKDQQQQQKQQQAPKKPVDNDSDEGDFDIDAI